MDKKPGAFGGRLSLSWMEIIMCMAVVLVGVVLLILPGVATAILFNVIGIICIIIGIVHIIKYCALSAQEAIVSNDISLGLAWIIGGTAIIIFKVFLASLLPILFGLVLLVGGIIKIQTALGFKRMHSGHWVWDLVCAVISVVLSILILTNPFATELLLMRVIGASLVVEGGMDLAARIAYKRAFNKFIETRFVK